MESKREKRDIGVEAGRSSGSYQRGVKKGLGSGEVIVSFADLFIEVFFCKTATISWLMGRGFLKSSQ